ncbi:transposase [Kurthia zopfii]|uniref:Transposase n=1 Tax=Kurthia zopfii TaxID=1650 RepID=A0A3S4WD92_9BACL|nr:IS21 family transposase [Kurthia zopfii]TDR31131.1 transposase [Kurthia zopfii]STX09660.1 Transposase and inactivated derivatives [Kurthia zopfii]VEI06074.1 Transposase and inactivated derivatives [Kurthia zopfii]VEI06590.1 Transposase and inactivated derivatives [Kurthia zopfii]VEI07692.1 Transposase and inactivated derivatives [Kurthia zopfii]
MLAMPEINCIKLMRNQKSLSINHIAKTLHLNWRTVKKYADEDQLPQEKVLKRSGMMYEEKWGEIVSDWLWEDQKLKRKKRRTNQGIFTGLQALGFKGSYRTVSYFIKEWRESREDIEDETTDKNYERLIHPPAEAQLDFGLMEAVQDGKYRDIHCLIMTLPFSNDAYSIPLPSENQECLLYGLKKIFQQLGGVPRKIRIDNMVTAVTKPRNKHEETVFANEFLQFANHYGFEPQACNPYSGHEKGNVENKVGYVRYNFITPAPVIENLEHLTNLLQQKHTKDRERIHYEKKISIQKLLEEEFEYLLALPDEEFPVFKENKVQSNKYGEITLDKVRVYIPRGNNYPSLSIVKYWNRFKVLSPHGEILYEDNRPYMHKNREIPWQSILKSWLSKPRTVSYSRFSPYLPGRIYEYINISNLTIRKERLHWLIALLVTHNMNQINDEFYDLLSSQSESLKEPEEHPYDVNWSMYDQLQSTSQIEGETP